MSSTLSWQETSQMVSVKSLKGIYTQKKMSILHSHGNGVNYYSVAVFIFNWIVVQLPIPGNCKIWDYPHLKHSIIETFSWVIQSC